MRAKSTGWRVPLVFCVAVIFIASMIYQFLPEREELPDLPAPLIEKAKNTRIELENPEGKPWYDAIVQAATGFAPPEAKDAKLYAIFQRALQENRKDAAFAAIMQMRDDDLVARCLSEIYSSALGNCVDLHWAASAVYALRYDDNAGDMERELTNVWNICQGESVEP